MKYLFCRNAADRACGAHPVEEAFVAGETPESLSESIHRSVKEMETVSRRYSLPAALTILLRICLGAAFLVICCVIDEIGDVPLTQMYRNMPAVFWAGGCALAVAAVLIGAQLILRGRMERSEEGRSAVKRADDMGDALLAYHGIPGDAAEMDVLSVSFRSGENGAESIDTASLRDMMLFRRDSGLCLFDGMYVYALPTGAEARIRLSEQPIPLQAASWHKDDKPTGREYRRCGVMTYYSKDLAGFRFCCSLEFNRDGEEYGLLFPAYELPAMQRLTGLDAPELPPVTLADRIRRRSENGKTSPEKKPPRPRFYWWPPRGEFRHWLSDSADFDFRSKYPVLYGVLAGIALILVLLPGLLFGAAASSLPGAHSMWLLAGGFGGFIFGVGQFNIVSAWIRQYMGHVVTLLCFLLGAALMAVSWHCML